MHGYLSCGRSLVLTLVESNQTTKTKIGICYFSDKHTSISSKSKDWFARNRDNTSGRVKPKTEKGICCFSTNHH